MDETTKAADKIIVKQWSVELSRGLHLLRYNETDAPSPPQVRVACTPPANSTILHPDFAEPLLERPGCSLVVRAIRPSQITIQILADATQSKKGV